MKLRDEWEVAGPSSMDKALKSRYRQALQWLDRDADKDLRASIDKEAQANLKKMGFHFVTDESEEFEGVPSGPDREKARALSEKWWGWTLETARKLKAGDAVTIGYQSERLTIRGFVVTAITGAGSLTEGVGAEPQADR